MTTAAAPRWSVNLSMFFTELPLLDRPAAAAAVGFTAAELWWPFDDDPSPADSDVAALRRAFADAGIRLSGLNLLDDLGRGERGTLSDPAQTDRFRANLPVAVALAEDLGCTALNALYGNRVPGLDPADQDELALENLALAARAAHDIGAVLLVEALNAHESPRYPLVSAQAAVAVVDRVNEVTGLGNAHFLCDVYHLSRMGEDPLAVVDAHADRIGHVQIADVPDLQTSHRHGNASMLAADFVLGVGNRWAQEMNRAFGRDTRYVSTIGLSQIQVAQLLAVHRPRHWINAGQAGPLGWTVPAALGVATADPGATVVALSGDYDFQFMIEELAVGAQFRIPYIHVVVNNAYLGLIRQAQRAFDMDYCVQLSFDNVNAPELGGYGVDHVRVAEGLGCKAVRVVEPDQIRPALNRARKLAAEYRVPGAGGGGGRPGAGHQRPDGPRVDAVEEFEEPAPRPVSPGPGPG